MVFQIKQHHVQRHKGLESSISMKGEYVGHVVGKMEDMIVLCRKGQVDRWG